MSYPKPVRTEWDGNPRSLKIVFYENGSSETWLGLNLLYIDAPNPFGGKWTIRFKTGVHNNAWRSDHIRRRRGKCWVPVFVETGWGWTQE